MLVRSMNLVASGAVALFVLLAAPPVQAQHHNHHDSRALELDPDHVRTLLLRGELERKEGDPRAAIATLTRVVELDPSIAHTLVVRAQCYLDVGDAKRARADLEPGLAARKVVLSVEHVGPAVPLQVDLELLLELVTNLVTNAAEALEGAGGGRIQLTARADDARFELAVDDDGPGLPPSLLPTLFQPFHTTKA